MHPTMYRTQLCKEGVACRRAICFFAHTLEELREAEPAAAARCCCREALAQAKSALPATRAAPAALGWPLGALPGASPDSPVSHLISRSQSVSSTDSVMSRQASFSVEGLLGGVDLRAAPARLPTLLEPAALGTLTSSLFGLHHPGARA